MTDIIRLTQIKKTVEVEEFKMIKEVLERMMKVMGQQKVRL